MHVVQEFREMFLSPVHADSGINVDKKVFFCSLQLHIKHENTTIAAFVAELNAIWFISGYEFFLKNQTMIASSGSNLLALQDIYFCYKRL